MFFNVLFLSMLHFCSTVSFSLVLVSLTKVVHTCFFILFLPQQVSCGKLIMLALWAASMVFRISSSGRLLRKLPYVPTRFQQLSYRFFAVQVLIGGAEILLAITVQNGPIGTSPRIAWKTRQKEKKNTKY